MRLKHPLTAFSLAVLLFLCAATQAVGGTLTGSYAFFIGNGFPSVSFTYSGLPYGYPALMGVGTRTDSPGVGVDTLVSSPFDVFCVELGQDVHINQVVTYDDVLPLLGSTTSPFGGPTNVPVVFDATRTLMLGRLWGTYHPAVVDYNTAGAFQLAVWELAFDTDQTLAPGLGVMFSSLANPIAAQAETWLADIRNLANVRPNQPLLLLTDPDYQDFITPAPGPAFGSPEPSSLVLGLFAGLGAVVFFRRRRSATVGTV